MTEIRFDLIRDMEKWRERMTGEPVNHGQMHTDTVPGTDEGKGKDQ